MAMRMEGPLSKWTNVMKGWQYRWFVLDHTSGILSYYTSKEKMMKGSRRGCVRLKGAVIGIDDEDDSTFTITVDHKTFHFQARDEEERERWIEALEKAICHLSGQNNEGGQQSATLEDFEKKLMETDAYLQLLIEQNQALSKKIDDCPNEADKERYNIIKVTADAMIEAIKHSIVQLQISKENLSTPLLNGAVLDQPLMTDTANYGHFAGASRPAFQMPKSTSCKVSEVDRNNQCGRLFWRRKKTKKKNGVEAEGDPVPEFSYSSSEDEEFYDAEGEKGAVESASVKSARISIKSETSEKSGKESHSQDSANKTSLDSTTSSSSKKNGIKKSGTENISKNTSQTSPSKHEPVTVVASPEDYFDELYDVKDDEGLGNMAEHGSVVGHLMSQIRIGMDLTKIVLPTFILERRSLLEMFADFFSHPDTFCQIADQKHPRDRMVQVVKWYVGMFHAGRPSEIAKKPYNPIIGEIFRCYWNVPGIDATKETPSTEGPTPWCTKGNLSFIAEQVSHHPPISAFYAENYHKRISLDGYVWTKSKFLGLSIGVHMIGQCVLSVLDYNEEYSLAFPSGYGRSILSVPWVEMGGKIPITCAKSGYSAIIDFHTKPFYGGKKHRVTGQIFEPNEKKPFCNIEGEWNGVMYAKYTSGQNETFVDTKTQPIIKKIVKPHDTQDEFESRRLWRTVTQNLKDKNVEAATEGKRLLEHRQREEAKERKEKGLKWQTKHFHEVGEHWVYEKPLVKRLKKKTKSITS